MTDGDLVCIVPTKANPNRIAAMIAAAVLFEMLCRIADRVRTR